MNANTEVDQIPEGYRPATAEEAVRASHPAYFTRMVLVVGGNPQPMYGFAIRD